jgi:hypothetical protein
MKFSHKLTTVFAAPLVASLLTSLTFAVPVSVFHYDSDHCDPLSVPRDVDELGIGGYVLSPPTGTPGVTVPTTVILTGHDNIVTVDPGTPGIPTDPLDPIDPPDPVGGPFPEDERISAFAIQGHMPACHHSDDPDRLDSIVSITNLTSPKRSFSQLWYVANPNVYLSNYDGYVGQLGFEDAGTGLAFRIDGEGHNRPLLAESGNANGIFEPGETWKFVIQDYDSGSLGIDAAGLASIGVAGGSLMGGNSSGSIIGIPVPEPTSLALLAIGLVAPLLRRRSVPHVASKIASTEQARVARHTGRGSRMQTLAAVSLAFALVETTAQAQVIDRFFTVQPIQLCNDAGGSCAPTPLFQTETEKIFAQAGVAPIFLPTTQLNDSDLLASSSVSDLNVPGNGQHADPLTINMWFVEDMPTNPGWVLYGEAYVSGNGVAINGTAVQNYNGGTGRIDTVAHEIGHNMGLGHGNFGAGGANNLLTQGSSRDVPGGIGHITPDGDDLSQLTVDQIAELRTSPFLNTVPEVLVDTNGSTPYNGNDFFLVDFSSGPAGMSLASLTMDLSPVNAFLDPTNAYPGLDGSPFAVDPSSLVGLNAADITASGDTDGSQVLTIDFAPDSFTGGDSFRFGIDVDLNDAIDTFGATPEQLIGTIFSFEFESGLGSEAEIAADLIASSIKPSRYLSFAGDPVSRVLDVPFEWHLHPDPIRIVPEPSSLVIVGLGLVLTVGLKPGRTKQRLA